MNIHSLNWLKAAPVSAFPENGGACVMLNGQQIAIFNFALTNKWYATDNECPHKHEMALARGMIGDTAGEPKVACPFHKKTFSLETGLNLQGESYCIRTYPVKVEDGVVYVAV
ncbi:MAG: nitrite reductase (NAD(P)H) small subunit [Cytophagia bacterium]|nr:MAG: nitrite reductase (NAD(P)H) small subunit [Runella sp.]TAG19076.1 MAG: nitrite reductase (NAD(P)H) small subunit [Cytophagales bacterium]TAG38366.1 MAG: nitrite reductase (NAD(P)H) small subunit [Cytophagia bacterium]TAG75479.1 MAG: nitrite reductase (NAD(P)H) small subunit [Runella slithyformis]TAG79932.1 MAG: nitrite reductase (NAD(P)H) small subunit [Cytophagales bacterium]